MIQFTRMPLPLSQLLWWRWFYWTEKLLEPFKMINRTVLWNNRIRLTRITHSKSWFILQIWYAMCKSGPKVQWYFHLWLRQIAHVLRWEAVCITSSGREMSFWFYSTDSGMLVSMASLLEHTVTIAQSTTHFFI